MNRLVLFCLAIGLVVGACESEAGREGGVPVDEVVDVGGASDASSMDAGSDASEEDEAPGDDPYDPEEDSICDPPGTIGPECYLTGIFEITRDGAGEALGFVAEAGVPALAGDFDGDGLTDVFFGGVLWRAGLSWGQDVSGVEVWGEVQLVADLDGVPGDELITVGSGQLLVYQWSVEGEDFVVRASIPLPEELEVSLFLAVDLDEDGVAELVVASCGHVSETGGWVSEGAQALVWSFDANLALGEPKRSLLEEEGRCAFGSQGRVRGAQGASSIMIVTAAVSEAVEPGVFSIDERVLSVGEGGSLELAPHGRGWGSLEVSWIGDRDRDGKVEIFYFNEAGTQLYWSEREGTERWSAALALPELPRAPHRSPSVVVADVDGDELEDLVVSGRDLLVATPDGFAEEWVSFSVGSRFGFGAPAVLEGHFSADSSSDVVAVALADGVACPGLFCDYASCSCEPVTHCYQDQCVYCDQDVDCPLGGRCWDGMCGF